jgi:hypothetical protein
LPGHGRRRLGGFRSYYLRRSAACRTCKASQNKHYACKQEVNVSAGKRSIVHAAGARSNMNDCGVGRVISAGEIGWTRLTRSAGQNPHNKSERDNAMTMAAKAKRRNLFIR